MESTPKLKEFLAYSKRGIFSDVATALEEAKGNLGKNGNSKKIEILVGNHTKYTITSNGYAVSTWDPVLTDIPTEVKNFRSPRQLVRKYVRCCDDAKDIAENLLRNKKSNI